MTDSTTPTLALVSEADARLARLVSSLDELADRMTVSNLMHEGWEYTRTEAGKAAQHVSGLARNATRDSLHWARENRTLTTGGAFVAMAAIGAVCALQSRRAKRRRPVPLYAAYDMEDPSTMYDEEDKNRAWDRVRDEASNLGARAGETYYAARSKAALLRESLGERAGEATESAHIAAGRAREKVVQARDWATRQREAHPWGIVLAGAALGVAVAALASRRTSHQPRPPAASGSIIGTVSDTARRAYAEAAARLDNAGLNTEAARNELRHAATASRRKLDEVRDVLADRLHTKN